MSGTRRIGAASNAACNFFSYLDINTEKKLWKAGLVALSGKPGARSVRPYKL